MNGDERFLVRKTVVSWFIELGILFIPFISGELVFLYIEHDFNLKANLGLADL